MIHNKQNQKSDQILLCAYFFNSVSFDRAPHASLLQDPVKNECLLLGCHKLHSYSHQKGSLNLSGVPQ